MLTCSYANVNIISARRKIVNSFCRFAERMRRGIAFFAHVRYNIKKTEGNLQMILLFAGVAVLGIGVILVSTAHKKYGDNAPSSALRKVGLGLVFLGTAVL